MNCSSSTKNPRRELDVTSCASELQNEDRRRTRDCSWTRKDRVRPHGIEATLQTGFLLLRTEWGVARVGITTAGPGWDFPLVWICSAVPS
ncbi:hypothetical protein M6B38_246055 [Iris pallida]|uniref:Uncharacterized protein n=1 Tax=Iris pallida TaxID=29817 RepID=A0AAX6DGV7_IRIPA|nr:hypothetical protein M6B38_246055 [Iris pallida]